MVTEKTIPAVFAIILIVLGYFSSKKGDVASTVFIMSGYLGIMVSLS